MVRILKPLQLALTTLLTITTLPVMADAINRETLHQQDVDLPSNQIKSKVIRVKFAPGAKTPLHTHDGPGPRYILKGKLKIEDSGTVKTYGAGEVFWETGAPMTVENTGTDEAEMIIFEMAPRNQEAKH